MTALRCFVSFADDTTVLAKSRQSLISMLRQIRVVFAEAGLKLNAGKCKVQTIARVRTTDLKVDDMVMPIMPVSEGFKILGTQFTLLGRTSVEL